MNTEEQPAKRFDPELSTKKRFYAVVIKLVVDIVLISALATYAGFKNFNPLIRGAIDEATQQRVSGWAHDPLLPMEPLEVQLFIDDQFAASVRANDHRDDLVNAGAAKLPFHGYHFDLTPFKLANGPHRAQVYVVHAAFGDYKTLLPLTKQPPVFQVTR